MNEYEFFRMLIDRGYFKLAVHFASYTARRTNKPFWTAKQTQEPK